MSHQVKVGIVLFNEVEVLDFAGPYEVFSLASKGNEKLFKVSTIAESVEIISARNGLKVLPDFSFMSDYTFDIVIIPGGYGAEEIEIRNPVLLEWIKSQNNKVEILASVCTALIKWAGG